MNRNGTMNLHSQRGISLIEVLVALIIMSIGLIGAAGLQVLGLKNITISGNHSTAAILAHHLAERMHVNRANIADYTALSSANCAAPAASIAERDYCEVYTQVFGDRDGNGVNTDPGEGQLLRSPDAGEYLEVSTLSAALGTFTININWKENDMRGVERDRSYTFNFSP